MKIKSSLFLFACLGVQVTHAAVTYVGFENGIAPTYTAQNWSNPSSTKTYNTAASEVYGSLGYYYLAPLATDPNPTAIFSAVVASNINAQGTLLSKPIALSADPAVINGTWVNFPGYATLVNPSNSGLNRIGAISAGMQVGGNYGFFNDFTYLPVLAGQSFRFGIMVDTLGEAIYGADAVSIYDPTDLSVTYSSLLVRDGFPELVFFDIANTSASTQTYSVGLHRADAGTSGFSLLTFDPIAVPEPGTWALLGVGLGIMAAVRRRRRIA